MTKNYPSTVEEPWFSAATAVFRCFLCCAVVASWIVGRPAAGQSLVQRVDSYEGGATRWQLTESDCQAQLVEHDLSVDVPPHAGRASELFQVACGHGKNVLLAYPIEPCLALNEFQPRIWVRCSSGGIQLGVRVIFPFAEHPVTQGRLHAILWGDAYSQAGEWQALRVTELERLLQETVVSLRQQFGSDINLDGAFIDCLVLNAYTGPGRYRVQVDDLDLQGMIPLTALGKPLERDWREHWRWRHALPDPEVRFWATANRPPVWLQYHDEPLPWLRSFGFTGLLLDHLPDERQLVKISQAGLGVIAPPPNYDLELKEESQRAIKGWLVGAALDAGQADVAKSQVQQVLSLSEHLKRPIIGEALEQYWMFSRMADEVIVPLPGPMQAGTTRDKFEWLSHQLLVTRQRGHGWVSINIGEPAAIVEQYRTAEKAIGETPAPELPTNPMALRYQAVSAILAGAQGIIFRASQPLDTHGDGGSATVAAIRLLNQDLELWGPWIMAGQAEQAPKLNRPDYVARAWSVGDSQLVIATYLDGAADRCLPPTRQSPLQVDINSSRSRQVMRVTHGQLSRVQTEGSTSISSFAVEQPEPLEVFVISENPRVMEFVRSKIAAAATQRASDHLEISEYNLRIAESIVATRFSTQIFSQQTPFSQQTLDSAVEATLRSENARLAALQGVLERGWQRLRANQPVQSLEICMEANEGIQAILHEAMLAASESLASPQSSPLVLSPALLPMHWKLAAACERSTWTQLPMPGGDLSSLNELLGSWWQKRRIEDQVDLRVEVLPRDQQQSGGLRLAAYQRAGQPSNEPLPGGYQGASLLIRSAAVPVQAGQLIRVSAMANVLRTGLSPDSGLLVYDNQAGPALGQLVRGAEGTRTKIELYRLANEAGEFRILVECRGECDVVLESFLVEAITPATNRASFPIAPLGAIQSEFELHPLEQK